MNEMSFGLIWSYVERLFAQVVSFAVSIIIARIVGPDEYGAIAIVLVIVALANSFSVNGLGASLIQKKEATRVDYGTALVTSMAGSLIIYVVVFCLSPLIEQFFDYNDLSMAIRIMSLQVIIASYNTIQQAYVSRQMRFKLFFYSTAISSTVSGIVGVILAYSGYGIWALVSQYLLNSVIYTIVLSVVSRWKPCFLFSMQSFTRIITYGWKIFVAGTINTLYEELNSMVIGKKYSASDLGCYNRGNQFPAVVVTNLNSSINSVLFPGISKQQENTESVKLICKRYLRCIMFLVIPCLAGMVVSAEEIVELLLTDAWSGAVVFLQIGCLSYLFLPLHTINTQVIKALGRSDIYLGIEVTKKAVGISLLIVAICFGKTSVSVAIAFAVSNTLAVIINSIPNKRLIDYGFGEQMKDILPMAISSLIMMLTVCLIPIPINHVLLRLVIRIVIGMSIYIGASYLLNKRLIIDVFSTVKRMIIK